MRIFISNSSDGYFAAHSKYGICRTSVKKILQPAISLPVAIADLIKKYRLSAYDINNGNCDEFAEDLQAIVGGDIWETNPMGDDTPIKGRDLPSHVWLFHSGKHYDAQVPNGVSDWKKLPIFKQPGVEF